MPVTNPKARANLVKKSVVSARADVSRKHEVPHKSDLHFQIFLRRVENAISSRQTLSNLASQLYRRKNGNNPKFTHKKVPVVAFKRAVKQALVEKQKRGETGVASEHDFELFLTRVEEIMIERQERANGLRKKVDANV